MSEQAVDQQHGSWSHTDLLLAAIFDGIQALGHIQLAKAGVKQDPPPPLKRPGIVERRAAVNPQAIAYLERIRQARGASREGGSA